jgi:hypothetical protein
MALEGASTGNDTVLIQTWEVYFILQFFIFIGINHASAPVISTFDPFHVLKIRRMTFLPPIGPYRLD